MQDLRVSQELNPVERQGNFFRISRKKPQVSHDSDAISLLLEAKLPLASPRQELITFVCEMPNRFPKDIHSMQHQ